MAGEYYEATTSIPTIETLNANSNELRYGNNVWTDDIKDNNGNWKYNDGYPILKWQLNIK